MLDVALSIRRVQHVGSAAEAGVREPSFKRVHQVLQVSLQHPVDPTSSAPAGCRSHASYQSHSSLLRPPPTGKKASRNGGLQLP